MLVSLISTELPYIHCEYNSEVITKARVTAVSDDEDDEQDDRTKKKRKKKNMVKTARWVRLSPSFHLSLAYMLCRTGILC